MLAIVVSQEGEPAWRRTFATTDVRIGHDPAHNQLVLRGGGVRKKHLRVVVDGGHVRIVEARSNTRVDGREIDPPRIVMPSSRVQIGDLALQMMIVPADVFAGELDRNAIDPIERRLLDDVVAGDDASRLVYADWLEREGDQARAELLRLQQRLAALAPDDPAFERALDRLRELSAGVDLAWRARVAKRAIENCPAFEFECPKQWSELAATDRADVRHCGTCAKDVHYFTSVEEARGHAAGGGCVALDVTSPRWQDDLEGPFGMYTCCGVDVGRNLPSCPRCGAEMVRHMVRGRMMIR